MWCEKVDNHIYIFHNGEVIYKGFIGPRGAKTQPSVLFNKHFPNEQII